VTKPGQRPSPRLYAAFLGVISLATLYGGVVLMMLGGSAYYVLASIALAGVAWLLWRGRREGLWLYGAIVVFTTLWAVWEAGFHGWRLAPRLAAWFVVGAWMLLPSFRRRLGAGPMDMGAGREAMSFAGAMAAAMILGALLRGLNPDPADPRYQAGVTDFPAPQSQPPIPAAGEWREWGRDKAGARFSPLTQITRDNVRELEVVWSAPLAATPAGKEAGAEATPLMVGDTLYTCNGVNEIFALDAETGAQRWHVDAGDDRPRTCRGVAYYEAPGAAGLCAARILAASGQSTLSAFDAATGRPCPGFGDNGTVNLLEGMSAAPRGYYYVTSAPAVVRDKIVVGGWVTDGQFWGEPSGVIRAFDAVTGELAWAWDMGRPDRMGAPPPGETYTPATPNSWAPISADEDLGLVYLPIGNPTPDYFGVQRRPFDDQYASSVVALDAETGRLRWSFQTTHHDLWDYDVASQPILADLPEAGGGVRRALIQMTKRGEIFVLDRETGAPLREVEERPVSQRGAVPEERLSPTQPFSVGMPSFRHPDMTEREMWGLTPLDQLYCRIQFRKARYDGPLTPPGLTPWISSPGFMGGMNWGSASIDRDHQVMIVNTTKLANYSRLITREQADALGLEPAGDDASREEAGGRGAPQLGTPYGARISLFLSPLFAPCQEPPHGFISAVDLTIGKLIWTRPLGTARGSGPLAIPLGLPFELGTPMVGGPMTTRAGLIFIAATNDRHFRALDVRTGEELWRADLPQGGFSIPMTYISPKSGRQFVAISTGRMNHLGGPPGATLIAYALPQRERSVD
jgi:quinoprotein glucose dehydrogenase